MVPMCHEYDRTLRQADQARADFAAIESQLEFMMGQLVRLPTRKDLARLVLLGALSTAGFVLCGVAVLFR